MSEDSTRQRPPHPIPQWVVALMLLIGVGWVMFLCVLGYIRSGPTAFTTAKKMGTPLPTGSLETTPKTEK